MDYLSRIFLPRIRFLLLGVSVLLFTMPISAQEKGGEGRAAADLTKEERRQLLVQRVQQRVEMILAQGGFSAEEIDPAVPVLGRFALQEIVLLNKRRQAASRQERRKLMPEVQANIEETASKLNDEVGPDAARKFRTYLQEERKRRVEQRKQGDGKGGQKGRGKSGS